MEQNASQENQTAKQIAALHEISSKYQKVIASDSIIQREMDTLMGHLRTSDLFCRQHCENIINYLLKEIHASTEDEHCIDDESQVSYRDIAAYHDQDFFRFKDAMTDFQLHHINQS